MSIEEFIQKATITDVHNKLRQLDEAYRKSVNVARDKAQALNALSKEYNLLFDKYEKLYKKVYGDMDYEI